MARMIWLCAIALSLIACGPGSKLEPLPRNGKVLAFGDSITYGVGAGPGESYPEVLQGLISREVINGGVPGETTGQGLARLPRWLDAYQPNVVILCHGANDFLLNLDNGQTADNLRGMIGLAQARGIGVVLVAVPKFRLEVAPAMLYGLLAAELGVPFEPGVLSRALNDKNLRADPIHPNSKGYQLMAEALADKLKAAGAVDAR